MKMFRVVVNGSEYRVGIEELPEENPIQPPQPSQIPSPVSKRPEPRQMVQKQTEAPEQQTDNTGNILTSPMPGTIIKIAVSSGDVVSKGQTLLVLEAMKMENEIKSSRDGTVAEIKVSQGTSVNAGDILIVMSS